MPEISPRIYQRRDVSLVLVSADYYALTVGLRVCVGGGWEKGEKPKEKPCSPSPKLPFLLCFVFSIF